MGKYNIEDICSLGWLNMDNENFTKLCDLTNASSSLLSLLNVSVMKVTYTSDTAANKWTCRVLQLVDSAKKQNVKTFQESSMQVMKKVMTMSERRNRTHIFSCSSNSYPMYFVIISYTVCMFFINKKQLFPPSSLNLSNIW